MTLTLPRGGLQTLTRGTVSQVSAHLFWVRGIL